jgi:cytochrome c553
MNRSTQLTAILVATIALASTAALAGDAAAGKAKAGSCGGCHGANGEGKGPAGPTIAGLDEAKFVASMKDYKSGKKASGPMKSITASLSDADFENLAAHYASLKK